MPHRSALPGVLLVCATALSSCVIPDDTSTRVGENATVYAARQEMIGLSETELRMCAGFPSAKAAAGEDGEIWTYQRTVQRGNMNVVLPSNSFGILPAVGGSLSMSQNGYCNTQVRLVEGRVVEIAFAGDNNQANSLNALCVNSVDSCVVYARAKR